MKYFSNNYKSRRINIKKVLLLLANEFETFKASVFIDVIGWNYIDDYDALSLGKSGVLKGRK